MVSTWRVQSSTEKDVIGRLLFKSVKRRLTALIALMARLPLGQVNRDFISSCRVNWTFVGFVLILLRFAAHQK